MVDQPAAATAMPGRPAQGSCQRFPAAVRTAAGYLCGEHQPTPAADAPQVVTLETSHGKGV